MIASSTRAPEYALIFEEALSVIYGDRFTMGALQNLIIFAPLLWPMLYIGLKKLEARISADLFYRRLGNVALALVLIPPFGVVTLQLLVVSTLAIILLPITIGLFFVPSICLWRGYDLKPWVRRVFGAYLILLVLGILVVDFDGLISGELIPPMEMKF